MTNATAAPADDAVILIVANDATDSLRLSQIFGSVWSESRIVAARDGIEALHYLHCKVPQNKAPIPDLIVLSLDSSEHDDLALLAILNADAAFRKLPTIVITESDDRSLDDKVRAYGGTIMINNRDIRSRLLETRDLVVNFWFEEGRPSLSLLNGGRSASRA